jgi:hypothetical protein
MPKTGAERQKELRHRRSRARVGSDVAPRDRSEGEARLDMWVRTSAANALRTLAQHHGLSRRETLEALLIAERDRVTG